MVEGDAWGRLGSPGVFLLVKCEDFLIIFSFLYCRNNHHSLTLPCLLTLPTPFLPPGAHARH